MRPLLNGSILRQSSKGDIYGLTYVDLKTNVSLTEVILAKSLVLKGFLINFIMATKLLFS
jgi:hypothetical protein